MLGNERCSTPQPGLSRRLSGTRSSRPKSSRIAMLRAAQDLSCSAPFTGRLPWLSRKASAAGLSRQAARCNKLQPLAWALRFAPPCIQHIVACCVLVGCVCCECCEAGGRDSPTAAATLLSGHCRIADYPVLVLSKNTAPAHISQPDFNEWTERQQPQCLSVSPVCTVSKPHRPATDTCLMRQHMQRPTSTTGLGRLQMGPSAVVVLCQCSSRQLQLSTADPVTALKRPLHGLEHSGPSQVEHRVRPSTCNCTQPARPSRMTVMTSLCLAFVCHRAATGPVHTCWQLWYDIGAPSGETQGALRLRTRQLWASWVWQYQLIQREPVGRAQAAKTDEPRTVPSPAAPHRAPRQPRGAAAAWAGERGQVQGTWPTRASAQGMWHPTRASPKGVRPLEFTSPTLERAAEPKSICTRSSAPALHPLLIRVPPGATEGLIQGQVLGAGGAALVEGHHSSLQHSSPASHRCKSG